MFNTISRYLKRTADNLFRMIRDLVNSRRFQRNDVIVALKFKRRDHSAILSSDFLISRRSHVLIDSLHTVLVKFSGV
jgi:hypothetical protein